MDIEVIEKKENPLLERIEVRFKAVHQNEPTPSRDEIRDKVAKLLKATKDKVILDSMQSEFGRGHTTGYVKVYKSKDAAKKYERDHILVRNELAEKAEKAEKLEKPQKPPKAEKPEKPEKAEKTEKKPKEEKTPAPEKTEE